MWRNLTKVQSTIQKLSQAVAPAVDDEEYSSGSSYYEEYEDEDEDLGEEQAQNIRLPQVQKSPPQTPAAFVTRPRVDVNEFESNNSDRDNNEHESNDDFKHRTPFGFVGLIARALDTGRETDKQDHEDSQNVHLDEKTFSNYEDSQFYRQNQRPEYDYSNDDDDEEEDDDDIVEDSSAEMIGLRQHGSKNANVNALSPVEFESPQQPNLLVSSEPSLDDQPPRSLPPDHTQSDNLMKRVGDVLVRDDYDEDDNLRRYHSDSLSAAHAPRMRLIRESGSISPGRFEISRKSLHTAVDDEPESSALTTVTTIAAKVNKGIESQSFDHPSSSALLRDNPLTPPSPPALTPTGGLPVKEIPILNPQSQLLTSLVDDVSSNNTETNQMPVPPVDDMVDVKLQEESELLSESSEHSQSNQGSFAQQYADELHIDHSHPSAPGTVAAPIMTAPLSRVSTPASHVRTTPPILFTPPPPSPPPPPSHLEDSDVDLSTSSILSLPQHHVEKLPDVAVHRRQFRLSETSISPTPSQDINSVSSSSSVLSVTLPTQSPVKPANGDNFMGDDNANNDFINKDYNISQDKTNDDFAHLLHSQSVSPIELTPLRANGGVAVRQLQKQREDIYLPNSGSKLSSLPPSLAPARIPAAKNEYKQVCVKQAEMDTNSSESSAPTATTHSTISQETSKPIVANLLPASISSSIPEMLQPMVLESDSAVQSNENHEADQALVDSKQQKLPSSATLAFEDGSTIESDNDVHNDYKNKNSINEADPKGADKLLRLSQQHCDELERELKLTTAKMLKLEQQVACNQQNEENVKLRLMQQFQEKEVRLLEAAQEDHDHEMRLLQQEMQTIVDAMRRDRDQERTQFEKERIQMEKMLDETTRRAEWAERELQNTRDREDNNAAQLQQRVDREFRLNANKLAETLALLDDREETIGQLQTKLFELQTRLNDHKEGAIDAKHELEDLQKENTNLRKHYKKVDAENTKFKAKISQLEDESEKLKGLKMELQIVKEDRDRERMKNQSAAQSTESNTAQLEEERNVALARVRDLEHQLKAMTADLEISKADTQRVTTANLNLQSALEAIQNEREAELSLMEEQQRHAEEVTAAAHAAALEATHEAHDAHLRQIQSAADAAVRNLMDEMSELETKLESYRVDNVQMRRSLDEAIQCLQTSQEDVIDRTLMKNILLDWLIKKNAKEKTQVLEVMASLLHFTDDEKERVHIDTGFAIGTLGQFVAAPLPPSKADLEHLEGNSVTEKWVNFLLAETD